MHKRSGHIVSFRGQIGDGGQHRLNLHTNDGKMGYRIKKFNLMFVEPGSASVGHVVKIYKIAQTTIDDSIDFDDPTLLASGYLNGKADEATYPEDVHVVFDSEVVNQDIFVTHQDAVSNLAVNYYIEMEQFPLDLNESTVATLKNIKANVLTQ